MRVLIMRTKVCIEFTPFTNLFNALCNLFIIYLKTNFLGYQPAKLVKLCLHLNSKPVDEFSRIVHISNVNKVARQMVNRLKELVPRQQFQVAIQAIVGKKVLARETLQAYRKDVTQKLKSGGDMNRRKKLLRIQSEAKKRLRSIGDVKVPQDTFIKLLSHTKET